MNPFDAPEDFLDVLPPEGDFSSRKDLVAAINAWAFERGYAFVVKNSWKTTSERTGVIYSCDCGTKPPSASRKRLRDTSSRYTGCLFSVIAKESPCKTVCSLKYRPDTKHHEHNHKPTKASVHPTHRHLSSPDRQLVRQLANSGSTPKAIISHLRAESNTLASQKDINKIIAQGKRDLVRGQSNIHALEDEGFWNRMRLDPSDKVTAVLFAHPTSLEYLKLYPEVLILDCTHKTNKYRRPLLNAIGVDACQRSFCIAFAFFSGEEEEDYNWALTRLRSIYHVAGAALHSVILTDCCLACMNAVSSSLPESIPMLQTCVL